MNTYHILVAIKARILQDLEMNNGRSVLFPWIYSLEDESKEYFLHECHIGIVGKNIYVQRSEEIATGCILIIQGLCDCTGEVIATSQIDSSIYDTVKLLPGREISVYNDKDSCSGKLWYQCTMSDSGAIITKVSNACHVTKKVSRGVDKNLINWQ